MDITRATIFEKNINNNLWPKFVLAMAYIKNNQSTKAVQNFSSPKIYIHKLSDISHLHVLGFTIYIFLCKEE